MKLSAKEKLLAAGAALYLVGLEFGAAGEELNALVQAGHALSSPEVVSASNICTAHSMRYQALRQQYQQYLQAIPEDES